MKGIYEHYLSHILFVIYIYFLVKALKLVCAYSASSYGRKIKA
ncbi:Hypothetical protein BN2458_PEG0002 [Helicobacter typhlonius]|uniref:Uncharacterized protein n=1 Tax=Helicobacter typhlonius TaxID=76936 RepID=A0A0S4PRN3_9HELI|nr:Hypothetical protein BN2458_PEG0002 [Helicobacter typhlonius]